METISKNRWQISTAVMVIFLLGFLAGALTLNLYQVRSSDRSPGRGHKHDHDRDHGDRMEGMIEQLNLNDQQKTEVNKILADARGKFRERRKQMFDLFADVRQQVNDQLKTVLTPEQWQQFEAMVQADRERHKREHGGRGDHHDRDRRNRDENQNQQGNSPSTNSPSTTNPPANNPPTK